MSTTKSLSTLGNGWASKTKIKIKRTVIVRRKHFRRATLGSRPALSAKRYNPIFIL